MPVTVDANIVEPMKLMEMADASSGMLARNVTLGLIAPAGGGAAATCVEAAAGRKESGRTAAASAVARRLLMRQDFAVGSPAPARSAPVRRGASPARGGPRCRSAGR